MACFYVSKDLAYSVKSNYGLPYQTRKSKSSCQSALEISKQTLFCLVLPKGNKTK